MNAVFDNNKKVLVQLEAERIELRRSRAAVDTQINAVDARIAEINKSLRDFRGSLVMQSLHTFLELCPDHRLASCSDENPCNPDNNCSRCILLDAKKCGYWDDVYEVNISITRVEPK